MLPITHGAYVTGVFVQDWNTIRDKDAYIILTVNEGIVFKVVENHIKQEGKLILHSMNPLYDPYDLEVKDIREVWQFVHYISNEIPENVTSENYHLVESVKKLTEEVKTIQTKLKI